MKKNSVFWGMLGLSAALHSLVMVGVPGNGFRTPPPTSEDQFVSTRKMIKVGTRPQPDVPNTPIEKKIVEKSIEAPPELPPVQEPTPREEVREEDETQERDSGNDEEVPESEVGESGTTEGLPEGGPEESGPMTNREYAALLAYIKEFIDKNLVYPPMARRRNIEGVAGVHFVIERNGCLSAITVDHSSGSSILDNAAVALIKKIHPPENLTLNRTLALRINIAYELTE
jgi:protein TonB